MARGAPGAELGRRFEHPKEISRFVVFPRPLIQKGPAG